MNTLNGPTALQPTGKLHGLDHLRAFAISFVFLYHYGVIFPHPQWAQDWGVFGWTGVDLFFVLSGYLIASQLFREMALTGRISLQTFFKKRFLRIVPAYWVVVALYFCVPAVRERGAPAPLWKFLTFTQNIGLDLQTQGCFSHAWSLCIEEQFYLLLPFLLIVLFSLRALKRGGWLLAVLFAGGIATRYYLYRHQVLPHEEENMSLYWYKAIYYPTWCRLDGILTGVGIAAMAQYRPRLTRQITRAGNWLFVLALGVLSGAYFLCFNQSSFAASVWGFPLVSIGYGLLVLSAISPASFLYKTPSRITALLATSSYGLYLIHKMIIHLAQAGFAKSIDTHGNTMFLLCMLLCLCGAWLLRIVIEQPFLKLRNKWVYK